MKLTILGSGGATPTPRPFCRCLVCKRARKVGEPFKRNSSSLFINDISALFDCGEDIGDSLNRRNVKNVESLFITHWHPDHTYGLRPLLEAFVDFETDRPNKQVTVYIPTRVFKDLKQHYPSTSYFTDHLKVAIIRHINHFQSVKLGKIKITAIGYKGEKSHTFAYLLEENNKRVLYAPCDTIDFQQKIYNLDLLINECGLFSYEKIKEEIPFPELMERIKTLKPKRTILTHIEEIEIKAWGWNYLEKMKNKYKDVNFDSAFDGRQIEI